MRILLVSSSSGSRGGGEIFLRYLGQALADAGHEIALWASSGAQMDELCASCADFAEILRAPYINTYSRPLRGLDPLPGRFADLAAIRAQWRGWRPDVIHLNKQNLEDGLDLLRWAPAAAPAVCSVHITQDAAYLGARGAWARDHCARRALSKFPGTFATTPPPRVASLRSFIGPAARVVHIRNGAPDLSKQPGFAGGAALRERLGIADDALLMVAVGRFAEQKRPMDLLDHAQAIAGDPMLRTRVRIVWIGDDGALRAPWERRAQALGGAPFIRCLPWQDDLAPWLAAADVFAHTDRKSVV